MYNFLKNEHEYELDLERSSDQRFGGESLICLSPVYIENLIPDFDRSPYKSAVYLYKQKHCKALLLKVTHLAFMRHNTPEIWWILFILFALDNPWHTESWLLHLPVSNELHLRVSSKKPGSFYTKYTQNSLPWLLLGRAIRCAGTAVPAVISRCTPSSRPGRGTDACLAVCVPQQNRARPDLIKPLTWRFCLCGSEGESRLRSYLWYGLPWLTVRGSVSFVMSHLNLASNIA